jgi:hypothetical protein
VSAELKSGHVEASTGKISRDFGFPRRVARRLLHDKPFDTGTEPGNEHVGPQRYAAPIAVYGCCDAGLLTRRPAEADVGSNGRQGSNIFINLGSGVKSHQLLAPALVAFAQCCDLKCAGAQKAQAVETDAGEEV